MIEVKTDGSKMDLTIKIQSLDASSADSVKSAFKNTDISGIEQARLHLDGVGFMDSSGVGALLSIYKSFQAESVEFILLNPTPPVLSVLELLRLHRIFTIQMD